MKPTIDDLIIPAEIWQRTDVTPAGKILLALFLRNSRVAECRLRRALAMSHNGLRELKCRLAQQGLLTRFNATHPTQRHLRFNAKVESSAGHNLTEISPVKNGQKVTELEVAGVYSLTVPGEILSLRDVMAAPKLILTLYARNSQASTGETAAELNLSLSGLKKARNQLLIAGLLVRRDDGYAPQVPGLVFTEDGGKGHFVPDLAARQNDKKVAVKLQSMEEIIVDCERIVAKFSKLDDCAPAVMQQFYMDAGQQILAGFPDSSPGKDIALAYLKERENRFSAAQYVFDHCRVRKQRLEFFKLIGKADAEQLQVFRDRAETSRITAGSSPTLRQLLGGVSTPQDSVQCFDK